MTRVLTAFVTVFLVSGCLEQSLAPESSGPIDGTYLLTAATCDGAPATGAIATPGMSEEEIYSFAGNNGYVSYSNSACTIRYPFTASYAAGKLVTVASTGEVDCDPDQCDPNCAEPAATTAYTYIYEASSSSLTISGVAGNARCSSVGQSDPISLTLTPN
jgi:hypothetical protein